MQFAAEIFLLIFACVGLYTVLMFAVNGIRAASRDIDETIATGKTPLERHFDTAHKD